jgi:hypothetical protein
MVPMLETKVFSSFSLALHLYYKYTTNLSRGKNKYFKIDTLHPYVRSPPSITLKRDKEIFSPLFQGEAKSGVAPLPALLPWVRGDLLANY